MRAFCLEHARIRFIVLPFLALPLLLLTVLPLSLLGALKSSFVRGGDHGGLWLGR